MPVNTSALKTFAPAMRRQLLEAVGRKLDLLLHSQTPDTLSTYARQIAELREQDAENREQLLEKVAYTWFNRFCALRYLDARGWHPFGCKVLMPAGEGETQPELLKLMRAGSLPAELKAHTNEGRLHGLLDGQIPPAIAGADPQGEVYRELVLASCRTYHQLLPDLFEGLDDTSELLFPDDLLSEGSIAGGFCSAISDADCEDVEVIGWLYQFYISEKKDEVIGKVVKSEDIPAATQLFTPNWIVKYMVQNSLGATWMATYPDSPLKGKMDFYIQPAEQSPDVQGQLAALTPESLDPEDLTLLDPACGSGHILVEGYELLKSIYLERGYRQRDIPELILTKNIYGLDICPRAAQLAAFSVLMKGREDDRRLLERSIQLNVMALQDSTGLNVERLAASMDLPAVGLSRADLRMLAELFTHATTFGALIQIPPLLAGKLPSLSHVAEQISNDIFTSAEIKKLRVLVRQAGILARRYDAVVLNPPYMGRGGKNALVNEFVNQHFPASKNDLFACFIEREQSQAKQAGRVAIVAPYVWMFISAYQKLRTAILNKATLATLIQLEYNAFEPACIPVATFVLMRTHVRGFKGSFIRLSDFKGHQNQAPKTLEAIANNDCGWFYNAKADDLTKIPGVPVAYWLGPGMHAAFTKGTPLKEISRARLGIYTGDNEKFIRHWHELSFKTISGGNGPSTESRWVPYNKGGIARKWSNNTTLCVDWKNDGAQIRKSGTINSEEYFYKNGITWSGLTSSAVTFRESGPGHLFDSNKGAMIFPESDSLPVLLGFLNSRIVGKALEALNPTLSTQNGDIDRLPFLEAMPKSLLSDINDCVLSILALSNRDWCSFEVSSEFECHPLLADATRSLGNLESRSNGWIKKSNEVIAYMKRLEEENNRLFIDAYDLQKELSPEVPNEQITLTVNPAYRYGGDLTEEEKWERFQRDSMAEFLSYAIGCMMGRYSLDQPGLILADSRDSQAAQLAAYEEKVGKLLAEVQFKPDPDGIIPVLDGEWFEDDIVARTREFLEVTFPESTVTENLRFIEDSLGKDIRKYFCSDFYKDHLQTYKKRPIYWMVQSPKKGFACLMYLHRYTKDTLNQVLNNYFRPYLQKLEARLAQLGLDQLNDGLPTRERTAARKEAEKITKVLKECQAWEQDALLPLAQQRIELDLDDGVKVNYLKLQDVLATIPGLAAKED